MGDSDIYCVSKDGVDVQVQVLERSKDKVYVHYGDTDKRLDEWIPDTDLRNVAGELRHREADNASAEGSNTRKRKRDSLSPLSPTPHQPSTDTPGMADGTKPKVPLTEEEFDIRHHKQITAKRNFDKVNFGQWQIKTWYFSPYPLSETETDAPGTPNASTSSSAQTAKIPGVNRATFKSHGRTSDLLAGGLGRTHGSGERSILWVCDRCFKYMADGALWELHVRKCTRKHPPGRKVYQRGAHAIWEVDGAKEKLFCQNLSLFGKLFIDVKTLFFDCDNFLFYILTDADSQRDHVLGFFSKEKLSYDDYNLACIITLPPYQKKGYGMLMIEFSYELSRRAGKVGTPERPLSDLGLRSYLTYWIATLVRFLKRFLSVVPPEASRIVSTGSVPDLSLLRSTSRDVEDSPTKLKKKRAKGWAGEIADPTSPLSTMNDVLCTSFRTIRTTANPDGSATSHVVVRCTLADLARATNLRVEDAAFALNECGMLSRRARDDGGTDEVLAITKEMVDAVGRDRKVKPMCMELQHVLL
ncbi:hypothetical protein PLICRDRAFT_36682 [Plicaturopsis crispa FD-325 SS-3]|nr:hypothetical protein PLICRDRAFT_36682 [Plicaturopsis crispa FD-325 SS-3]